MTIVIASPSVRRRPKQAPGRHGVDIPLKTFPVTVPLLGPAAARFFAPPPEEKWSREYWVADLVPVQYSLTDMDDVRRELESGAKGEPGWYRLLDLAQKIEARAGSPGELLAVRHLAERWRRAGVVPYPHQIDTARKVLFEMGGRAILADEVGLGKTIEAGLIIKECLLRGLARRILILTPASLRWQWYNELREKFNLSCAIQRSEYDWERTTLLIASFDTAKREPHRSLALKAAWDMLVVDEAHKLKNERSQVYQFVNAIQRTYCLMLTATPLQNDLKELYNLINLTQPGMLGTYRQFKQDFVYDRRTPKKVDSLRALLGQVMVRNRRGPDTVQLTRRHVRSIPIDLSREERRLYEEVTELVRGEYRRAQALSSVLPLITLQREVCSSAIAAALTIERLLVQTENRELKSALQRLLDAALALEVNTKADQLVKLVSDLGEKVIVFTEYRATQDYLRWRLEKAGISTLAFNGSLSASRKGWIRELFRTRAQVLVSTESGGEGLNFQFCRNVVNYDLPWNPMKIEQRIGRVHRLGQTQDVNIYNLATRQTIEEQILYLLYEKIDMFQAVLGSMDAILSRLGLRASFEAQLTEILVGSATEAEIEARLSQLAQSILDARDDAERDDQDTLGRLLTW